MAKPTLATLASGVMSRLGQLTVQTAKKARVSAGEAAYKSLVEVNKMLDEALAATTAEDASGAPQTAQKPAKQPAKKSTIKATKKPVQAAVAKTAPAAAQAKRTTKR